VSGFAVTSQDERVVQIKWPHCGATLQLTFYYLRTQLAALVALAVASSTENMQFQLGWPGVAGKGRAGG
jgi:hypothetical protein